MLDQHIRRDFVFCSSLAGAAAPAQVKERFDLRFQPATGLRIAYEQTFRSEVTGHARLIVKPFRNQAVFDLADVEKRPMQRREEHLCCDDRDQRFRNARAMDVAASTHHRAIDA